MPKRKLQQEDIIPYLPLDIEEVFLILLLIMNGLIGTIYLNIGQVI